MKSLLLTLNILLLSILALGQTNVDSLEPRSVSYNDLAVVNAENENYWQAIQNFERAIRTPDNQRKIATTNLKKFKASVDLPAHTILHFGWINGIGKLANNFFSNFWLILACIALFSVFLVFLLPQYWSLRNVLVLLCVALAGFSLSQLRSAYIDAEDLVIFKTDTDLKDKPYAASDEKQIVFEGQMARVEQRYEGFLLVQTDTYETGWVAKMAVVGIWDNESLEHN